MIRFNFTIAFLMSALLTMSRAQAAQNELQSILSARTLDELVMRESKAIELKRAADDCQAELKARAVPRNCFLKIKLENRSAVATALDREQMDRVCRDIAAHSQSRLDLSRPNDLLTEGCRAVVAKRIDDLRYTDEETHPELSATRTLGPDLEE